MASFRPNVAAILRKPKSGRILIAERIDHPGNWQFPQGGIDAGEDFLHAMFREVEEEIGVEKRLLKVRRKRDGYRYVFPKGHLKKGKFCGQEQTYFLCDYLGKKKAIQLDRHTQEFRDYQWIRPEQFDLTWVPQFKRRVYAHVFRDFFGIDSLPGSKRSYLK
ncbi:MAG: NUDIX domain-containing protein [Verrucomicrobiota bacterium]